MLYVNYKDLKDKLLYEEYVELYEYLLKNYKVNFDYYINNICPDCGCLFDKQITSTRICPNCKSKITKRNNYYFKANLLLNERQLKEYDYWAECYHELNNYEKILLVTDLQTKQNIRKFLNKNRNSTSSIRDLLWISLNELQNYYFNLGFGYYKEYNNLFSKKDFNTKHYSISYFYTGLNFTKKMIEMCIEKKPEVALRLYCYVFYVSCNLEKFRCFNDPFPNKDEQFLYNVFNNIYFKEFIYKNDYSKEYIKSIYLETGKCLINEISLKDSWKYFEYNLQ